MEEQLVVLVDPWQDKYDRLLEANEKLQKLNQSLEEKLLKLAEKNHAETSGLSEQIQDLTQRLVDARLYIHQLADENDRYRNDINCVIQLLQCKPSNFISPKIETLPEDLQRKILGIKNGVGSGGTKKEKKIIKVQVPTFPPTDIMYAVDKGKGKKNGDKDIVSAAIMAKILQERENERKEDRRNNCHCRYRVALPTKDKASQTMPSCTISYSEFEFYSEPEDEEEQDDEEEENEADSESIVNHPSTGSNEHKTHSLHSQTSRSSMSSVVSSHPEPLPRRPDSWILPSGGRAPGRAVPVRMTTSFDEIIKTSCSMEEEARLPIPLFDRMSQSSTPKTVVQQHSYSNHHQAHVPPSNDSEHYYNHVHHRHIHNYHDHHHHHQDTISSRGTNGHGDTHSTTPLYPSSTMTSISSECNNTQNYPSDKSCIFATNKTATTSYSNNLHNENESSSFRDTPPPSSLQRSSSSSLSSPSSGLPPLTLPISASVTTDLNGEIMLTASSTSNSNAVSSACNTPSSSSTNGVGSGNRGNILAGFFHEPLPLPTSSSNSSSSSSRIPSNPVAPVVNSSAPLVTSISGIYPEGTSTNNVVLRKGTRLSTSHISNNGSVTTTSSTGLTKSTSWNRDTNHGSSSSIGSSTSSSGGGVGLMTSLGNHWRSTVLVHNPPRSHSTYEPLSLISVQGEQTTFSTQLSPKAGRKHCGTHNDLECISDSEQPLLQTHEPQSSTAQPSTFLFHAYHNPQKQQQTSQSSSGNGLFSTNIVGYNAANSTNGNTINANPNNYYRAQKRTWFERGSTTSTETEI